MSVSARTLAERFLRSAFVRDDKARIRIAKELAKAVLRENPAEEPITEEPSERPERKTTQVKPSKKKNPEGPCRPQYGRAVVDRVYALHAAGFALVDIERKIKEEFPGISLGHMTIALWIKYGVKNVRKHGREMDVERKC